MGDSYREYLKSQKKAPKQALRRSPERAEAAQRTALRAEHFRKSRDRYRKTPKAQARLLDA